jgi:polar amino acid transport system substrate-binding protein
MLRLFSALLLLLLTMQPFGPVRGQTQFEPVPFFDLTKKPQRPPATELRSMRFLTDDDYPPFHFQGLDGQLTGFNIDLARAICSELKIACTIQARRWDTLLTSLESNQGDAVIASMRPKETDFQRFSYSQPYYKTPARFVIRKDKASVLPEPTVLALTGKTIGVVGGTAHAAFMANFFPKSALVTRPDQNELMRLLTRGEVDAVFGDGISLSLWLNGSDGTECCMFLGRAFFENRYFGEGAMIAFRQDSIGMRRAVDYALYRLVETGEYQQIMLKYFPVRFY